MSNSAPFISAHGSGPDWQSVAQDCAAQLKAASPEHRLGFLYVTDHFSAVLGDISNFFNCSLMSCTIHNNNRLMNE